MYWWGLFVRPLLKETTQINLNILSYWEDILELRFNIKKSKIQHTGSNDIKIEYKLNNREIKK